MINRQKFFEYFGNEAAEDRFTQGKVYRFLYDLHSLGLLFHLDDDPSDLTYSGSKQKIFTPDEAQMLSEVIVPALFKTKLPDYGNDPYQICLDVNNPERMTPRVLPQWGFSFDDTVNNDYIGFTEPKYWNGWGCPLLRYEAMQSLLFSAGYTFTRRYQMVRHGFPPMAAFHITACDGEKYPDEDAFTIIGQFVYNTYNEPVWVYDTSILGLTFNIDDCQEPNKEDWEGYL